MIDLIWPFLSEIDIEDEADLNEVFGFRATSFESCNSSAPDGYGNAVA